MWEINNSLQILGFVRSILLGALFCFWFDILRSVRKVFNCGVTAVFWQDIIFWLTCAPITFCFLLAVTNGEIRAYVIFGIIIGFLVFRITLSKIFLRIISFVFLMLKKLNLLFLRLEDILFSRISAIFFALFQFLHNYFKKVRICCKKCLKKE